RRGTVHPPAQDFMGLLSPNYEHSRKPDNVYEYAEALPGPYVELFARRPRAGWACWGNQIENTASMFSAPAQADGQNQDSCPGEATQMASAEKDDVRDTEGLRCLRN
ncbi:MAG TPA: MT-A70 family methyltransferase, partial [Chloroflexota bacterium]|nr:MT-A70 family methyltransferase [Chloroflexota bacterium]